MKEIKAFVFAYGGGVAPWCRALARASRQTASQVSWVVDGTPQPRLKRRGRPAQPAHLDPDLDLDLAPDVDLDLDPGQYGQHAPTLA